MATVSESRRGPVTQRAITWAWALLVAITLGTWWLAPAHFTETVEPSTAITALVLALTAVKSRLIMQYFKEIRTAPRWLRRATDGWLAVLTAAVFVIYLF
ncbi:cytochrome C oxidase subunit IV family protein [Mycobacterium sp. SMC-4]|uniref:cytochrome C oxidase subunit IV family protein n=1 Tax=Mycobacterium sp. SMC-4 TaxID=2857059 RepID=UPI0021B1944A|nr:cytochrome C oxidase subunit IV family protein [Mycobacterium sp. SMC-4]UXA16681.1 cytochrome C oxidase subunit IV family protein [Mycobacterium sp. SMC-4]